MKKDLIEWIDRETARLDGAENGLESGNGASEPVPEALRRAFADEQDEESPQKQ